MTWSDIPFRPANKALRQFAAAWLVFFLVLGAHQYLARRHPTVGLTLLGLALVIGLLGLIKPQAVRWVFVTWMVAAFPIGWLISLLMLLLMFYCVMTPVALVFRLRRRDLLRRKGAPAGSTFWLPKHTPQDVRSYFRQY
jgi:peptidoglycan biosynthesis protein MviN/MurJ (putative lipid II flippase)